MGKKVFKLIKIAFTTLFIVFIIYTWINIFSSKKNGEPPSVFNLSLFVVETPSMETYLHVNDMIVVKKNDIEDVKVNDVISFIQTDKSSPIYGRYVTHRVIDIEVIDGKTYLTTKGDNNTSVDTNKVTSDNYYGKIIAVSTFMGSVMSFITSGYNFIFIAIFLFLIIFIIYQFNIIIKELKAKKEENKKA